MGAAVYIYIKGCLVCREVVWCSWKSMRLRILKYLSLNLAPSLITMCNQNRQFISTLRLSASHTYETHGWKWHVKNNTPWSSQKWSLYSGYSEFLRWQPQSGVFPFLIGQMFSLLSKTTPAYHKEGKYRKIERRRKSLTFSLLWVNHS